MSSVIFIHSPIIIRVRNSGDITLNYLDRGKSVSYLQWGGNDEYFKAAGV